MTTEASAAAAVEGDERAGTEGEPVRRAAADRRGAGGRIVRAVLIAGLVPVLAGGRCRTPPTPATQPIASSPQTPVASTQPSARPSTQPSTQPLGAPMTGDARLHQVQLPTNSWLRIEALHEGTENGWITGHCPRPNHIVIETQHVAQFSIDISGLGMDWSRRAWVRINSSAFELTHKRNPVVHLRETSVGAWEIVAPNDALPIAEGPVPFHGKWDFSDV